MKALFVGRSSGRVGRERERKRRESAVTKAKKLLVRTLGTSYEASVQTDATEAAAKEATMEPISGGILALVCTAGAAANACSAAYVRRNFPVGSSTVFFLALTDCVLSAVGSTCFLAFHLASMALHPAKSAAVCAATYITSFATNSCGVLITAEVATIR